MGLNDKPVSERLHIAFFGLRNAGKSSLVNAVTNQPVSLVSNVKGTTTDPVFKTMELLPLGPVVIIDTPGLDDEGDLGIMRVERAKQVLNKTDVAVVVIDSLKGLSKEDESIIEAIKAKNLPFVIAYNKADLLNSLPQTKANEIYVSAQNGTNITELKELIAKTTKPTLDERPLVSDLIKQGDVIVLVTPIDSAAPKGRLILPQQQTIRDILDCGAVCMVTKETELKATLEALNQKPTLIITDSQAFGKVNKIVPKDIPLTSFSILFARYKGDLETVVKGVAALDNLKDGDTVLISEGCTHHRQCGDIGTVKLPAWVEKYTNKKLNFAFTSGGDFPYDLSPYSLIIHCGGCMLNEKEMKHRQHLAKEQGVPITNYGIAIARVNGILLRSIEIFPNLTKHFN
ncbi:MAG: [Clostridia bacterium]|nr:[FeFe] hydrogenase H-cluster maturation GTPase HydF [Clostridia bacterium]